MEVLVLGPLRVLTHGHEVALERLKERAVLSVLALRAGTAASSDELIEALWPDTPPRTAGKTLQNHVLRLRRALGGESIITEDAGYRLDISADGVDAHRFDATVRSAAGGDLAPQTTSKALADALGEWRGDAYPDLAGWPVGDAEARRLREVQLIAEELHAEAELACGRHALATVELEAMARREPLRERRWELLMLALYREGRQAAALHAFADARRVLDRELGTHPGPALAALERAILRQDALLDAELPDYAADGVTRWRHTVTALDAADAAARAAALTSLGQAQRDAGDPASRETLLLASTVARDEGLVEQAAAAAIASTRSGGMGSIGGSVDAARVAVLRDAIGTARQPSARARALSSLASELAYTAPTEERAALVDEAMDIARQLDDQTVLVDVLLRRIYALSGPDHTGARDQDSIDCLALADVLDDEARIWAAANARAHIALQVGAFADCDRALTMAQQATDSIGTPGMRYGTLMRLAARNLAIGRISQAERDIERAFGIARATGQGGAFDAYSLQLVHLRHAQGRLHELHDAISALDLQRDHPLPRPFVAWALAMLGDSEKARAALQLAVTDAPHLHDDEFKLVALGYACGAAAELRDRNAAEVLLPLVLPYGDQRGNTGAVLMPSTFELIEQLERL